MDREQKDWYYPGWQGVSLPMCSFEASYCQSFSSSPSNCPQIILLVALSIGRAHIHPGAQEGRQQCLSRSPPRWSRSRELLCTWSSGYGRREGRSWTSPARCRKRPGSPPSWSWPCCSRQRRRTRRRTAGGRASRQHGGRGRSPERRHTPQKRGRWKAAIKEIGYWRF